MSNITQKQRAYEYLRERLVAGELRPGSRLSDAALAKEIGISRTPVREAINQLASEDLVTLVPHSGAFVKIPDREEIRELYDLRELLECYVVRKAAGAVSPENLAQLKQLFEQMDSMIKDLEREGDEVPSSEGKRRWAMTDYAFHLVLFRCGGNRKILRIASDLRMLTQAFIFRKDDPKSSPLETMNQANLEHGQLLAALRNGDAATAEAVMTRHIERAKSKTLANYADLQTEPPVEPPEWLNSLRGVIHE